MLLDEGKPHGWCFAKKAVAFFHVFALIENYFLR
jgi:hypothetical protein